MKEDRYDDKALRDGAERYVIGERKAPLTPDYTGDFPYITLTFTDEPDLSLDY